MESQTQGEWWVELLTDYQTEPCEPPLLSWGSWIFRYTKLWFLEKEIWLLRFYIWIIRSSSQNRTTSILSNAKEPLYHIYNVKEAELQHITVKHSGDQEICYITEYNKLLLVIKMSQACSVWVCLRYILTIFHIDVEDYKIIFNLLWLVIAHSLVVGMLTNPQSWW